MRRMISAICLSLGIVGSGVAAHAQGMTLGEFEYQNSCVACHGISGKGDGPVTGPEGVAMESQAFGESDALLEQARAFLASVAGGPPPLVSGRTGMAALETATIVGELVNKDK